MYIWFAHDGEKMKFYPTERGARAAARCFLQQFADQAGYDGEWCEEVERVCWGRLDVREEVCEVSSVSACEYHECEEGHCDGHAVDEYVVYELRPATGKDG